LNLGNSAVSAVAYSDSLIKTFGSLDVLVTVSEKYYNSFFTDEERRIAALEAAQHQLDQLNSMIGLSGEAALDTKDEFRAYIESLDMTTDAGRNAFQSALGFQDALLLVSTAAEQAAIDSGQVVAVIDNVISSAVDYEESLKQQESLYKALFTKEERKARLLDSSTAKLAEFNNALGLTGEAAIDTKLELRDYVLSFDLTSAAGISATAAAYDLQDALIVVAESAEAAAAAEEASAYNRGLILENLYQNLFSEEDKAANELDNANERLQGFNDSLGLTGDAFINTNKKMSDYIISLGLHTEAGLAVQASANLLIDSLYTVVNAQELAASELVTISERNVESARIAAEDLAEIQIGFYNKMYSEQEKQAFLLTNAQAAMNMFNREIGLTGDAALSTRSEFLDYLKSLDMTTAAGVLARDNAYTLADSLIIVADAAADSARDLKAIKDAELEDAKNAQLELTAIQKDFYQKMYSEAEKQEMSLTNAKAAMAMFNREIGLTGDAALSTRSQFLDYLRSLDMTTAAGVLARDNAYTLADSLIIVADAALEADKKTLNAAAEKERLRLESKNLEIDALNAILSTAVQLENQAMQAAKNSFTRLKDSVNADKNAAKERLSISSKSIEDEISLLTNLSSAIDGTLSTIRDNNTAQPISRSAAQSIIGRAATGEDIDIGLLQSSLKDVSKPSEGLFKNFQDYQRDFFKTSISINDLSKITSESISNEERNLLALENGFNAEIAALDGILNNATLQIDALNGIDNSIFTVNDSIAMLAISIQSSLAAQSESRAANESLALATTPSATPAAVPTAAVELSATPTVPAPAITPSWMPDTPRGFAALQVKMQEASENRITARALITDPAERFAYELAQQESIRIRGYANGGQHSGGLRMVGERGPELELTGPSRIISNSKLMENMGKNDGDDKSESKMNLIMSKLTLLIDRTYRLQQQWTTDALNVRVVA